MTKGWRTSLLGRGACDNGGLHTIVAHTTTWEPSTPRHPAYHKKNKKRPTKNVSRFQRSEADSNRCSSFCRAVPSHSAIRPYHPFGSANIQTFSFFTKFLPFFHRKVKISSLSHAKTSYRELILEHKYTHSTPNIGFLKKKRNFTLRKKAKRCTSKILR